MNENTCPVSGTPCTNLRTLMIINPGGEEVLICPTCPLAQKIKQLHQHITGHTPLMPVGTAKLMEAMKALSGPPGEAACKHCGMTLREFNETGKMGCGHCYSAFGPIVSAVVPKVQEGATQHVGKVPKIGEKDVSDQGGIAFLQRKLDEAVKAEKYEMAAKIRDVIRELEKKDS